MTALLIAATTTATSETTSRESGASSMTTLSQSSRKAKSTRKLAAARQSQPTMLSTLARKSACRLKEPTVTPSIHATRSSTIGMPMVRLQSLKISNE